VLLQPEDHAITTAERLARAVEHLDVVFAVGGGQVLDTAKYAAFAAGVPFVSVPTQASQDGICSPVAVLRDHAGITRSLGARVPQAIITCLDTVRNSSEHSIRAGVGDLLSNLSAVEDWRLSARVTGEAYDEFSALTAVSAARAMTAELQAFSGQLRDLSFVKSLVSGLVLSGIAMTLSGTSRPCSGAEHKISHALDELYRSPGHHGAQVALGMVQATYLRGGDWRQVVDWLDRVGLPVLPAHLGLTDQQMVTAIHHAPMTRPNRYTVLEHVEPDTVTIRRMLEEIASYYGTEVVNRCI
jgi:glycerol-1-phosphate dehydrogenase [NAD(P)+]